MSTRAPVRSKPMWKFAGVCKNHISGVVAYKPQTLCGLRMTGSSPMQEVIVCLRDHCDNLMLFVSWCRAGRGSLFIFLKKKKKKKGKVNKDAYFTAGL